MLVSGNRFLNTRHYKTDSEIRQEFFALEVDNNANDCLTVR
ncbi:hypothetical protein Enr8_43880 [Blastopirellula retiformator]|uniref:Uncharacterized protein n=1 Tax=Blastopirellula retiformator TaxID=2527970 RepID=A0A5C5UZE3_9BACT|nr:hypothetical protein Enr8_43880 [Blastopirellula retiformator]